VKRESRIYLTEDLAARLDAAAGRLGITTPDLVETALQRCLDDTEGHDRLSSVEQHLAGMSGQLARLDYNLRIVAETVAIHARHQLAVTPTFPEAAQRAAIGAARFDEFVVQVARRVRSGKPLMRETLDLLSTKTRPDLFASQDAIPLEPSPGSRGMSNGATSNGLADIHETTARPAAVQEGSNGPFRLQGKSTGSPATDPLFRNAPVAAFAGAFLGCLTTLVVSTLGIVPSIASALSTFLLSSPFLFMPAGGLFASVFFPAVYGGTFTGMTRIVWLGDGTVGHLPILTILLFISLSIICGLAFSVAARFDIRSVTPFGAGYGGRLGAIAAVASFLFVELAGRSGADVSRFHQIPAGAFSAQSWAAPFGFLACLGGILGTIFALRQRGATVGGAATRIFIASAVAFLGLLTLYIGNPDNTDVLDVFYAGCFLGMSTPERLKGWFQLLLGAPVLIAMLVLVRAFLPGLGGGLGLAAFASSAVLVVLNCATSRQTTFFDLISANKVRLWPSTAGLARLLSR
jgi:hypothetical protein